MTTSYNSHSTESPGHLANTTTHHSREQRLRGKLHEGWETICIGTALCDFCGKQSRGVVQKCLKCGLSICCQCSQSGALRENRNHRLDHDAVSWDKNVVAGPRRAVRRADTRLKGSQDDHIAPVPGNGEAALVHGHMETSPWFSVQRGWRCEKATQTPGSWCPDGHTRASLDEINDGGARCPDEEDAAHILAGMPTSAAVFCNKKPLDLGLQDDPGTASAWERQGPGIPRHDPGYYTNDHHHTYETLGKWEGNSRGNYARRRRHDHDSTNPQHQYHHSKSKSTHSAQLSPREAHFEALRSSAASKSLEQTTDMSRKRNAPPTHAFSPPAQKNTAKNG